MKRGAIVVDRSAEKADGGKPVTRIESSDEEEIRMSTRHTRNKLSGRSEEDIEITEQMKIWSTITKKNDEIHEEVVSSSGAASPVTPISCTMLQDLPVEVLDYILMKAVVKVIDRKLAKSSWINCASEMIKPLRSVGSQWDYRLTTKWFNVVLHRTLDLKQPTPITVKRIGESRSRESYECFAMLNDWIYCIHTVSPERRLQRLSTRCLRRLRRLFFTKDELLIGSSLHMFKGHDLENCVKTIPLPPVSCQEQIAICKRSKRIFLWQAVFFPWEHCRPVRYLIPDKYGGFEVRNWPRYTPPDNYFELCLSRGLRVKDFSVVDDGNVVVLRKGYESWSRQYKNIVSIHTPDGLVIRNIKLWSCNILSNVAMNSNGNLVFADGFYAKNGYYAKDIHVFIREVDQTGCGVNRFQWPHDCDYYVERMWLFIDESERLILHDGCRTLLFLDSKLRFLERVEVCGVNPESYLCHADFDKMTNEMISLYEEYGFLFHKLTF